MKKLTLLEMGLTLILIVSIGVTIAIWSAPQAKQDPSSKAEDDQENNDDSLYVEYDADGVPVISVKSPKSAKKPVVPALNGTNGKPALPVPVSKNAAAKSDGAGKAVTNAPKIDASEKLKNAIAATMKITASNKTSRAVSGQIIVPPEWRQLLEEIEQKKWSRDTEVQLLGVINKWAVQDPGTAMEYVLMLERRGTRNAAVSSILNTWSKQAPDAAYEWFVSVAKTRPSLVEGQTRTLFNNLVTYDINKAIAEVWALPTDNMKRNALGAVANRMISTGRGNDILPLYNAVDSAADKNIVVDVVMQGMGRYEPEELGQWIFNIQDPKIRSKSLDSLVSVWANDHPQAAAEWVANQLAIDADRAKQITKVTDAWVREDPVNTADWLLSLFPPSGQTDNAVVTFSKAILENNPGTAAAWSFSVTDSKLRWKLMEDIAVSWLKKDPSQARLYIDKTDLPKATKDKYQH